MVGGASTRKKKWHYGAAFLALASRPPCTSVYMYGGYFNDSIYHRMHRVVPVPYIT